MDKLITFDLYVRTPAGSYHTAVIGDEAKDVYLASDVEKLIQAARATLTEQRREFARGDVSDLDALEDAASGGIAGCSTSWKRSGGNTTTTRPANCCDLVR
jgi:hypothetical protein